MQQTAARLASAPDWDSVVKHTLEAFAKIHKLVHAVNGRGEGLLVEVGKNTIIVVPAGGATEARMAGFSSLQENKRRRHLT